MDFILQKKPGSRLNAVLPPTYIHLSPGTTPQVTEYSSTLLGVQHPIKQPPSSPLDFLLIFHFVDLFLSLGCFHSNYRWCLGHMPLPQIQLPGFLLKQALHPDFFPPPSALDLSLI